MKRWIFFIILIFSLPIFSSLCNVTFIKNLPYKDDIPGNGDDDRRLLPNKFFILGNYLYVHAGTGVARYDISNPENIGLPIYIGQNSRCGDTDTCTFDAAYWQGDSLIFISNKGNDGLRGFDLTKNGFPCVGSIFAANVKGIAVIKTNGKRYLVWPSSSGLYYADFTNPPGNCQNYNVQAILIPEIKHDVSQTITFQHGNDVYMGVISETDPFTLYKVTNFPSVEQVFDTNDVGYDATYYNGYIYVNSRNNGLKIYNIPTGTIADSTTNYDYSKAYGINVGDKYIYLSLGNCIDEPKTGGFEILDKNSLLSVIPSDTRPNSCNGSTDFDIIGFQANGVNYFFRAALLFAEVYKLTCGDSANIVLDSYNPKNVDPGTTFDLNITLKNTGNIPAENVVGTLSESHSKVTVNTPSQNYGTIGTTTNPVTKSYSVTVAPDATAGPINFTLNVTGGSSAGNLNFTFNFVVNINEARPILTRSFSKNADNSIKVTYTNSGKANYSGSFNLKLISYTKGINFYPYDTKTFSNISSGQSQSNDYNYELQDNCSTLNFISLKATETPDVSESPAEEELNVPIIPGSYPLIKIEKSNLSKNQDGIYTLSLTLKNIGQAIANNVNVKITSDPDIGTDQQSYGNIAVGSTLSKNFTFTVPEGTTGIVNFTAEIVSYDSSGTNIEGCWKHSFPHDLADIKFEYVDEKHCGCGGNCLDEHPLIFEGISNDNSNCLEFYFKLINIGSSQAINVQATLDESVDVNGISVIDNIAYYNLDPQEENYSDDSFKINIGDVCTDGNDSSCPPLKLKLKIAEYNFEKELTFTIKAQTGGGGGGGGNPKCNLYYVNGSFKIASDDNSDGKANPGEEIQFTIEIKNTGDADAPSVYGEISEDPNKEQYIDIKTKKVSFGTIKAGQTARNSTPFKFKLTDDAPTGTYYFPLTISSSCSSSPFNGTIPLNVYSSGGGNINLSYQGYTVGSSGQNYLELGKDQTLYVTLKNDSDIALPVSKATLSTAESKVQIKTQGSYSIMPGKTGTSSFTVYVDNSFEGTSIKFHIEIEYATVTPSDFDVSVGEASPPPPPPVQAISIPILVHSPGANNTFWKTDLFLQNPSVDTKNLTLKLLKAEVENANPPQTQISLSPFSSLAIKDILENPSFPEFRGYSIAGLLIEFSSSTAPFVSARIYNDQGEKGTYGQFVPSVPVSNKTRGTSGEIPAYLVGMIKNSKYRSNIGLANLSYGYNEIKITIISSEGFPIGTPIVKTLAPYNVTQINNITEAAGLKGDIGSFTVKVESNSKFDFIAWGSVVDNITGDASFINDQIQQNEKTLIMGIAHATGAVGTNWRTDLNIYNPSSSYLTLILNYYRYGYETFTSPKRLEPIPPGGTVLIEDVLSKFQGLSENEAGFIIAYPEGSVDKNPIISARTYNDLQEKGTYGQFVSGLNFKLGGTLFGKKLYFSGITINDNFRANLGVLNGDETNSNTITVSLYSKEGNFVSSISGTLQPLTAIQINSNNLIEMFGVPTFDGYSIVVEGTGKTFAYVSQVDNKTSDPIFILPALR